MVAPRVDGSASGSSSTLAGITFPAETIFAAELAESVGGDPARPVKGDHFMPQFWGSPPHVSGSMMGAQGWNAALQEPTTVAIRRHAGGANYVFTDGHAKWHRFGATWQQTPGTAPTRNWYNPRRDTP